MTTPRFAAIPKCANGTHPASTERSYRLFSALSCRMNHPQANPRNRFAVITRGINRHVLPLINKPADYYDLFPIKPNGVGKKIVYVYVLHHADIVNVRHFAGQRPLISKVNRRRNARNLAGSFLNGYT